MLISKLRLFALAGLLVLTMTVARPGQAQLAYLYYVGGAVNALANISPADVHTTATADNGVFSIWIADVDLATSSISNWRRASVLLPEAGVNPADDRYSWMFLENAVHIHNGYLYVGPGDWNGDSTRDTADVVAYARIKPDGSLLPFQLSDVFPGTPDDQAIGATALVNAGGGNVYYYVLGGTDAGTPRVLVSKINTATGALGPWSTTTNLSAGDWFNRAVAVGTTIVEANGNLRTSRDARSATVTPATGVLSAWSAPVTYQAGTARWDYAMTKARVGGNDFVYIMGGAPNPPTVAAHVAPVTGGVLGTFTDTTSMPVGLRRVTSASVDDLIFVVGGTITNSLVANAQDTVYVARAGAGGALTWNPTPFTMPQRRAFGGAAIVKASEIPAIPTAADPGWTQYE